MSPKKGPFQKDILSSNHYVSFSFQGGIYKATSSSVLLAALSQLSLNLTPHLDVSENSDTPKSSILIGFSIINHPFRGIPIFGNTYL